MRANKLTLFFILLFLPLSALTHAQVIIPSAPAIKARAYVVMDADSGKIIAQKNGDKAFPPASLTKLMTSYVLDYELAQGRLAKNDKVRVSKKAWKTGGSRMFIRVDSDVSVSDLMKGIIIQSGNDASVAIAEHIAGSEDAFSDLMNQHADRLGMHQSNFLNATGLPKAGHVSSALDMAKLARAIIRDYPEHYSIYSEKYFTYNKIRQANRNRLLWRDSSVDGLKTGHTKEAGYGLVTSAKRKGMRLITVVMGATSDAGRTNESKKLLAYAFRFYRTHQLAEANETLIQADLWQAEKSEVRLGLMESLAVTLPSSYKKSDLKTEINIHEPLQGAIAQGEVYGSVQVFAGTELVQEMPLVALEDVSESSLWKYIWHSILLFIFGLFS